MSEPWFAIADAEMLARALYETDGGANGYPSLHKSVPWSELNYLRTLYFRRADEIRRAAVAHSQSRKES